MMDNGAGKRSLEVTCKWLQGVSVSCSPHFCSLVAACGVSCHVPSFPPVFRVMVAYFLVSEYQLVVDFLFVVRSEEHTSELQSR